MSLNCHPLKCTGCSARFPFPNGINRYADPVPPGGVRSPTTAASTGQPGTPRFWDMLELPVWCLKCDGPSFVERIPSQREFAHAAGLRKKSMEIGAHGISDELLYLDERDFAQLYEQCMNRSTPPKCVLCGSSSYVEISMDKSETGLKHGACWGSPILARGIRLSGFNGPPVGSLRLFDLNGELAWSTIYKTGTQLFWLDAVIHIPRNSEQYASLRRISNLLMNGNDAEAVALIQPLLEEGDGTAIGMMGALHYLGRGVEHNGHMAETRFKEAIGLGDLSALHNLAKLYSTGAPGLSPDTQQGQEWHHAACNAGAVFDSEYPGYGYFRTAPLTR